ncbi:PEP-CTERM sorting domain-containing protein [Rhodanobacter terrae]|jgi:hypothetical protein|uniref:PEP-CTERM sorting domain-containing protein n=1 Tax=Rhodanobacter terrae TaxID=418647 RepID=A0ABW0T2A5_9GAMM
MLKNKRIVVALACALALGAWSGSTLATPVTVGGITWDPASGADLTVQALNFRESSVAAVGNILTGYGQIGSINGSTTFCTSCDLTFTFQYTLSAIEGTALNPKVVFDAGSLNFYVAPAGSFNTENPTTAGIGTPWLTLSGHTAPFSGFTAVGQLYSNINGAVSAPGQLSGGFGLVDATGGPAAHFMDTNSQPDGADFSLSSAFSTFPDKSCTSTSTNPASICYYPIVGAGTLTGRTLAVPEPGPAGMLGLGLAFVGLLTWRRNKEAEGRA